MRRPFRKASSASVTCSLLTIFARIRRISRDPALRHASCCERQHRVPLSDVVWVGGAFGSCSLRAGSEDFGQASIRSNSTGSPCRRSAAYSHPFQTKGGIRPSDTRAAFGPALPDRAPRRRASPPGCRRPLTTRRRLRQATGCPKPPLAKVPHRARGFQPGPGKLRVCLVDVPIVVFGQPTGDTDFLDKHILLRGGRRRRRRLRRLRSSGGRAR